MYKKKTKSEGNIVTMNGDITAKSGNEIKVGMIDMVLWYCGSLRRVQKSNSVETET